MALKVVEITVDHRLKPIQSQELPTKKVTENPIFTDQSFIAHKKIDRLCFISLKSYRYSCSY